ncbi:MAG: hypothetical protein LBS76_02935 [Mycoplasmataceae bacterium]|nr:hypothetical protein [Mycoplasmataceae bacterium]
MEYNWLKPIILVLNPTAGYKRKMIVAKKPTINDAFNNDLIWQNQLIMIVMTTIEHKWIGIIIW